MNKREIKNDINPRFKSICKFNLILDNNPIKEKNINKVGFLFNFKYFCYLKVVYFVK